MLNKKLLIAIIAVLLLICLISCGEDNPPNGGKVSKVKFFDLSRLNYNTDYIHPDNPDWKGFVLYDHIDFNKIDFKKDSPSAPYFKIYFDGQEIGLIEKSPSDHAYPVYTFTKTGIYTIKVYANETNGKLLEDEFEAEVKSGGYPDKAEFTVFDKDGNKVEEAEAGKEYRLVAQIYSEGVLIAEDGEMFECYWEQGEKGQRTLTLTLPNQVEDDIKSFSFYCVRKSNDIPPSSSNDCRTEYVLNLPVKNNYLRLEFDYADLSAQSLANVVQPDQNTNILDSITAKHVFANGDISVAELNYQEEEKSGAVCLFIKYDDEKEYQRYRKNIYVFGSNEKYYINNNTYYQFDPRKNSAEIYLAYCRKTEEGGYEYTEIEKSRISFKLKKDLPSAIGIDKIIAFEKAMESNTEFEQSRYDIIDGEVKIKVQVTKEVLGSDINNHYFYFDVNLQNEAWGMNDYKIIIENIAMIEYNNALNRFYPKKEGKCKITVKSFFGNVSYTFTVNIINPLKKMELSIPPNTPNLFVGEIDLDSYVQIKEIFYNNTSGRERALKEDEELRYFNAEGKEIKRRDFVPGDKPYKDIHIYLFKENAKVEISECCQTSFYVLPEFSLTIGGEKIKPDELEEKELFKQKEYIINLSVYRAKDIKKEDIEIIADNADKKYEIDYGISFNSDIYIKYKINEDLSVCVFKIKTIINVLAL